MKMSFAVHHAGVFVKFLSRVAEELHAFRSHTRVNNPDTFSPLCCEFMRASFELGH